MNLLVPSDFRLPAPLRDPHARARLNHRIQKRAHRLLERYPSPPRALADPPPGSGLRPVMGDFGPPGIGHILGNLADPIGFARERTARYGPVQWMGGFGRPIVGLLSPAAVEDLLLDRNHVFSAQQGWEFLIGPFFKGGILLRDFDEHAYHRRILQQAFTRTRLIGYLDLTTPRIVRGIDAWEPGSGFLLYDRVKELLLEQATVVFAGAELGPEGTRLSAAFEAAVHGGQAIVRTNLPGGVWHRGLRGRRVLEEYFRREIGTKRAGDGDDLFSVLCRAETDDGDSFGDADIIDHMIFVMMAAHDTSTIAISMLGYELARAPEWQDRLRAESRALGKPALDYADLDRLPGLDLAFREILRMHAPVGQLVRQAIADTEIQGHYIPKGTLLMAGPHTLMRSAEYWHDPDVFDPGRFEPARAEDKSHRFAWPAFGGGAHKCIGRYFGGMTVKAVLHRMLLGYRWSVPDGYRVPLVAGTGPKPGDGLPVRLERI
ncbi:cytochrome P450 [Nocardia yamanashiensis]|uniref:cytochrome P450 n=1 Tax=Nocardia yamanashiensis TaxID=209247 RepID=UPI001E64D22B|nr:cytochrome P450 [Nocardia yamanashiensis]UGT44656.1 cytochrome P450 [Nocardia yamanashiensis]